MSETSHLPKDNQTPWDDCKVAFGVEDDERALQVQDVLLPVGWKLCEIDGSGARWVAVFRVEVFPTKEDGARVLEALRKAGAL